MKKIIPLALLVVVVVAIAYFYSQQISPASEPAPAGGDISTATEAATANVATFDTADGQHMFIAYDASGDNAVLSFRDDQFILVRSGSEYSTADGKLQFSEQDGEATVNYEGKTYTATLADATKATE